MSRFLICDSVSATGKRISITKPLTNSASDAVVYLSEALNVNSTELNKCDYVAISLPNSENTAHEVITCTKENYNSTNFTMSSCTRGVIGYGSAISSNINLIAKHEAGTEISIPVLVQDHVARQEVFDGEREFTPKITGAPTWVMGAGSETAQTFPVYADATARDAAITIPKDGMIIYNTADGEFQQRKAGSWDAIGDTGTPNASETVPGKVQIATQAQVDDGVVVGSTGAKIVLTPDKLNPKNLTNTKATVVNGDSVIISDSEATGAIKKTLFSTIKTYVLGAASFLGLTDTPSSFSGQAGKIPKVNAGETALEFFTQAVFGVLGGNSAGGINNLSEFPFTIAAGSSVVAEANTQRDTNSTSLVKVKEITCPETGTYSVSFDISVTTGGQVYGLIYKNGVAFGTLRNTNGGWSQFSENLAFTKGDKIQLYFHVDSAIRTGSVRNFSVKCAVTFTPPTPVGTVNLN